MAILNGILNTSYAPLEDILSDNDSSTYEYCILAIRKRTVDVKDIQKGQHVIYKVAVNMTRNRYQSNQSLWDTMFQEQRNIYHAHIKNFD